MIYVVISYEMVRADLCPDSVCTTYNFVSSNWMCT